MRILILHLAGIGDFVEVTPVLRRIRELYPDSTLSLAVSEKAFPLAKTCPYVNDVIGLPTSPGSSFPAVRDLPRWLGRMMKLRGRFDMAINLYRVFSARGSLWMRFILGWSGAKTVVASDGVPLAGESETRLKPQLWISDETLQETRQWMRSLGDLPIVVFLGGERRTRHENPARVEMWLSEIQKKWNAHPVVIGSRNDPGLLETTGIRHTDMRGKTDLEKTAAIIACSAAVITTHSAPQHLAGVWDVPTIVLVGPGDPDLFHPRLDPAKYRMLRNPVECAPCYHMDCPLAAVHKQKCMTGISPGTVVQAFSEIVPVPASEK